MGIEIPQILEWTTPADAWHNAVRSRRLRALVSSGRVLAVTALVLWAGHHWFAAFCSPDLPRERINQILAGYGVIQIAAAYAFIGAFGFILLPQWGPRTPPVLGINDEGLMWGKGRLIRWDQMASFIFRPDNQLRDRRVLVVYFKTGHTCDLPLPNDVEKSILAEFSRPLPQGTGKVRWWA